jgi:hypothetical protein
LESLFKPPVLKKQLFVILMSLFVYSTISAQFNSVGSTVQNGDCFVLTPNNQFQTGAVWSNTLIDLDLPFSVSANIDLGDVTSNDADGIAFVLQRVGDDALGLGGGSLGYVGLNGGYVGPDNSLGVAFPTYTKDRIEIWNNSVADISGSPAALPSVSGLNPVTITWDPILQNLTVDFNNDGIDISWNNDIVTNYFEGGSIVYWGFTGATGNSSAEQSVCDIEMTATPIIYTEPIDWNWVGSARPDLDCFELTQNSNFISGAVWSATQIDLNFPFTVSAIFNMGDFATDNADGIAFVLQQYGDDVVGVAGGDMGYVGIGDNSLGVVFRTWMLDQIEIWNNERTNLDTGVPPPLTGSGPYPVTFQWDPETTTLTVDFKDDGIDISFNNDIINNFFGGNSMVYWGFTSATGGRVFNHSVCDIQLLNPVVPIPTLSEWGLILVALLFIIIGILFIKERARKYSF